MNAYVIAARVRQADLAAEAAPLVDPAARIAAASPARPQGDADERATRSLLTRQPMTGGLSRIAC